MENYRELTQESINQDIFSRVLPSLKRIEEALIQLQTDTALSKLEILVLKERLQKLESEKILDKTEELQKD